MQLVADVFDLKDDEPRKDLHLKEANFAIMKTPMWHRAGPGTVAALEKTATILERHGAKVEELSFPAEFDDPNTLNRTYSVVADSDAQAAFLKEYRMDKSKLAPAICSIVENSSNYTHKDVVQAQDRYARMRSIFDEIAARYTAIISPSAVDEAPLGIDDMGSVAFNWFWTVSDLR